MSFLQQLVIGNRDDDESGVRERTLPNHDMRISSDDKMLVENMKVNVGERMGDSKSHDDDDSQG